MGRIRFPILYKYIYIIYIFIYSLLYFSFIHHFFWTWLVHAFLCMCIYLSMSVYVCTVLFYVDKRVRAPSILSWAPWHHLQKCTARSGTTRTQARIPQARPSFCFESCGLFTPVVCSPPLSLCIKRSKMQMVIYIYTYLRYVDVYKDICTGTCLKQRRCKPSGCVCKLGRREKLEVGDQHHLLLCAQRIVPRTISGPTRPHKQKDPTNHGFWNPPRLWPGSKNVGSLCLCDLFGTLNIFCKPKADGFHIRTPAQ